MRQYLHQRMPTSPPTHVPAPSRTISRVSNERDLWLDERALNWRLRTTIRCSMSTTEKPPKITRTDAEVRTGLMPVQYNVPREKGTERAFTGPSWNEKRSGTYACVACGVPLFASSTKFDSGTGWPSFFQPIEAAAVSEHDDRSYFMRRTEI